MSAPIHLFVMICFFLDLSGGGHFEISARSYISAQECEAEADDYAQQKGPFVREVWVQCLPTPGLVT